MKKSARIALFILLSIILMLSCYPVNVCAAPIQSRPYRNPHLDPTDKPTHPPSAIQEALEVLDPPRSPDLPTTTSSSTKSVDPDTSGTDEVEDYSSSSKRSYYDRPIIRCFGVFMEIGTDIADRIANITYSEIMHIIFPAIAKVILVLLLIFVFSAIMAPDANDDEEEGTSDSAQLISDQDNPFDSIDFPNTDELPEFPDASSVQPNYKVNLTLDPYKTAPRSHPEINLTKRVPPVDPIECKPLKIRIRRNQPKRHQITVKLAKSAPPTISSDIPTPTNRAISKSPESTSVQELHDTLHQFADTTQTGDLRQIRLTIDARFDKPDAPHT